MWRLFFLFLSFSNLWLYIELCSLCFIISRAAEGRGVSCFLSVSLSFDLAEHSGMRTEPTQHYTLWTQRHGAMDLREFTAKKPPKTNDNLVLAAVFMIALDTLTVWHCWIFSTWTDHLTFPQFGSVPTLLHRSASKFLEPKNKWKHLWYTCVTQTREGFGGIFKIFDDFEHVLEEKFKLFRRTPFIVFQPLDVPCWALEAYAVSCTPPPEQTPNLNT